MGTRHIRVARRCCATSTIVARPEPAYASTLRHRDVACSGRAAKTTGTQYRARQLQLSRAPLDAALMLAQSRGNGRARFIADAFASRQETRELFPGDTAQFVTGIYRKLFKRSPDREGLAYLSNAIDRAVTSIAL